MNSEKDMMEYKRTLLAQSIFTIILSSLAHISYAEEQSQPQVLDAIELTAKSKNLDKETTSSYTVKSSNSSAKLNLTLKENPQSISVFTQKQIQDQNLNTTDEILAQTPGVSVSQYGQVGAGYTSYYARGFEISNVQRDGIPTSTASFGDPDMLGLEDSALYDRIEVVRGSTGLTNGSGNPSASINYVRKRPTKELTGSFNVQAGTWDNYRSQVDISGALNQDQSVRGRAIAVYSEGGSQQERFARQNAVIYGALDIDLTDQTTLTTAITAQQVKIDDATAHGFPFATHDKPTQAQTTFGWKDNPAADWTYSDTEKLNVFLGLEHQFNDDWKGVANYAYTKAKNDRIYGVAGSGGIVYDSEFKVRNLTLKPGEMVVTSGRFVDTPEIHALDLYLSGDFDAFGQQHSVSFGANGYRIKSDDPAFSRYFTATPIEGWNGQVAQPDILESGRNVVDEYQMGAFAAAKLQLLDPLKLIIGGRISQWERKVTDNEQKENGVFTPYAGLIFDITDNLSAYTSYTTIFNPSSNKDVAGNYLDPEEGNSFEVGLKSDFFQGRLNASAAYFQMQQDNFAVKDGDLRTPDDAQAYLAVDGAEVKGYEITVTGEILPHWHMQAGYTHTQADSNEGEPLNTDLPENSFKLFTTYQWDKLTVGGGVNWQSKIYSASSTGLAAELNRQDSYALVNLMGRYQVSPELSVGLNVNNLLDKEYKANVSNTWGTSRNMTASVHYKF